LAGIFVDAIVLGERHSRRASFSASVNGNAAFQGWVYMADGVGAMAGKRSTTCKGSRCGPFQAGCRRRHAGGHPMEALS
jgi:hypothetical protein